MDWLLLIGIGFLVVGALYWVIHQRPSSPLLYESALAELYQALSEIHIESSSQPSMTHTKSGLLLSYFYQYDNSHTPIHLHNISLTIPRGQENTLGWNDSTQRQITHFIVNSLGQNTVHTVLRSQQGILLINFLFTDDEESEAFKNFTFDQPSDLSTLLNNYASFNLEEVPQNMESLMRESEKQMESDNWEENEDDTKNNEASKNLG